MAFPERVYVRDHRRLAERLDTSFPRAAFAGATLDRLFTGDVDRLDEPVRSRVLAFNRDLLACDCESKPYCGHAEEALSRWVLEARLEGRSPEGIVDAMGDRYHLYAYPADVLNYLDDAIRRLDAVADLAAVEGRPEAAERASVLRAGLEAGRQPSL
ncbi:MAG: DUF5814 domain-containing protein [Halobacteriota archaeon]